ncbi:MAG: hypothetical protein COT00_03395 [Candidatus Omnitrophica bacterium CG07_land_8_20_14_0_80_50_8]|nr:MAG: hypothetical protein COT00_03395 [Candidatus Omnitrophica bacterium CG07_land_8_20_14_0_80_50_8]
MTAQEGVSARGCPCRPVVRRLDHFADPLAIYRVFRNKKTPSVLLESARPSQKTGRYSFIGRNPFLTLEAHGHETTLSAFGARETAPGDPFQTAQRILDLYASFPEPGSPPFTGGAIGYFGYEAKNYIEPTLPRSIKAPSGLPDAYLLFFNEGIIFDHQRRNISLFTNVKGTKDPARGFRHAAKALDALEHELKRALQAKPPARDARCQNPPLKSSFSRDEFIRKVREIKKYIRCGDIYQANLSQQFSFYLKRDLLEVYENLRTVNPSPFFGFLDAVDFQIISGSPERLVKLENGVLETRPIAGTRPRGKNEKEDRAISLDLILDPKERAEHIMLVDLERNDLGRVAEVGSVCVDELMALENYSHVKHIVSNVRGLLRKDLGAVEAFKAFFPGGTITGTPKIRSMEILDRLEPIERGPYTGSLGYFSFTGNMDFNIIIRSLWVKNESAHLQVGAGIVADSIPKREYEETLYKAEGLLMAIFGKKETRDFFTERGIIHTVS